MTTIRKAESSDVKNIKLLLDEFVPEGLILERSENEITFELERFYVAEQSRTLTGTVSYHDYGLSLKEIRSLVVRPEFQKAGTGRLLVQKAISDIRSSNPDCKIFTLTYAPDFFKKLHFTEVSKDTLPEKIWKDCNNCTHKDNCGETALVYTGINHI